MLPEQKRPRSRQHPPTPTPPLAPLPPTAVPDRHSVWIGAVCERCSLPIQATPLLDPTAVTPTIAGTSPWFHVVTGTPGCPAPPRSRSRR